MELPVAASTGDSGETALPAERKAVASESAAPAESPRLFIVCGRDRKIEEVRELFARCGAIRQLHIATDRSNKSRGFAFLQYEDPASAVDAIKQFDKTTLSDGHVLKVTVAREKSKATPTTPAKAATLPGKLKRNQHSQDDSDSKGEDGGSTDGGGFPGKRQRSSPPSSSAATISLHKIWKRSPPFASLVIATRSPEDEIADVLGGIIAQIERLHGAEEEKTASPTTGTTVQAAAKRKAPMASTRTTAGESDPRSMPGESSSTQLECESQRECKQKSQRTTASQATPNRPPQDGLCQRQRRHVRVDESDSSVDGASDASVGRRKRSNTEPDEADTSRQRSSNSRRRLSDLSELSLSPAGIRSPSISKKRCSRRSSASSSSSLPPYQATPFRHLAPAFVPALAPTTGSPLVRRQPHGPVSTLFFSSTVKFTLQELEAMFSVYEQFDHVQVIRSFGRVKTMAYVKYSTPEAARSVISSFLEDNEGEDHGAMKLAYADVEEPVQRLAARPSSNYEPSSSTAGQSTSSEVSPQLAEPELTHTAREESCWLMILYDRGLTNEAISSCVTSCEGMEFVDIKMFRSTGESQGVAFVKFETDEFAQAASRQLHNSEFPIGSRKFLQAIVITDPALFSSAHGTSSTETLSQPDGLPAARHHPGEDGDLGFVEARFAHLMSGNSDQHVGAATSVSNVVSADEEDRRQFFPMQRPTGAYIGPDDFAQRRSPLSLHKPSPPHGYFQFGQPFPYDPAGHTFQPAGYGQLSLPFYPQGVYNEPPRWGYEGVYPAWPGEATSPMPSEYNQYAYDWSAQPPIFRTRPPQPDVTSVFVSSSRPLDLSCLMKAIQECPGVVGFSKDERDGVAFVVDFGEPRLAAEAATKLDGTMCNGNKLRVAIGSSNRAPPSRRKRQRLDQRGRRK